MAPIKEFAPCSNPTLVFSSQLISNTAWQILADASKSKEFNWVALIWTCASHWINSVLPAMSMLIYRCAICGHYLEDGLVILLFGIDQGDAINTYKRLCKQFWGQLTTVQRGSKRRFCGCRLSGILPICAEQISDFPRVISTYFVSAVLGIHLTHVYLPNSDIAS